MVDFFTSFFTITSLHYYVSNIKGENYNVMVIGNKKDIDFKALEKLGKIQEMDIDRLFNYEKSAPVKG